MGFIKAANANVVAEEAERAIKQGRSVFVCRFDPGLTGKHNMSGSITGVAEMIEAVEAKGWVLDRFIEAPKHAFTGLFRRST